MQLCVLHTADMAMLVQTLALMIQSRVSGVFHVDIHPAAQMGQGVLLDHATGIVIGETAVVGDNVSMLHHVTLGGSGTGTGIRHPHIGEPPFYSQHDAYHSQGANDGNAS